MADARAFACVDISMSPSGKKVWPTLLNAAISALRSSTDDPHCARELEPESGGWLESPRRYGH